MNRQEELKLTEEVLELKSAKSAFLGDGVERLSYDNYRSEERFRNELDKVFRQLPHAIAHGSALEGPDTFLRASHAGVPLLITRDSDGVPHAFVNTCRHRGMQLVAEQSGCAKRFTCPYHAWSYGTDGGFLTAPHFDQGFGELDKAELGLKSVSCVERFGFIWITLDASSRDHVDDLFAPIAEDFESLRIEGLRVAHETVVQVEANWKLLVEGGLEAYHFKVAHKDTIGPYFENNLSTFQVFGDHIRSVLPRATLADSDVQDDSFRLLDHANILYVLFPTTQLLVQQDHIVWTQTNPISPGLTESRMVTLVPAEDLEGEKAQGYWAKNHHITCTTLGEDSSVAEGIQRSINAGFDQTMILGRFESALGAFNDTVTRRLAS
ncbi:SRPBCC family protein [Congregibacter brevis]|uniref:SRPBCC family protein n=1 Tax=Congregibacter brevis TaxID=3081201 RepID=A0ABZ0IEP2_9GAMM|nr:SRPBCC family protein [Congregibacter sp. IMCC45268]